MAQTYDKMVRAVRVKLDQDQLEDVASHGADAGWPGFTYYSDTAAFYKRHQGAIVELVEEMADSLGESPIEMVRKFRCLGNEFGAKEIGRALYGPVNMRADVQVANALAWFALETVARSVCEKT